MWQFWGWCVYSNQIYMIAYLVPSFFLFHDENCWILLKVFDEDCKDLSEQCCSWSLIMCLHNCRWDCCWRSNFQVKLRMQVNICCDFIFCNNFRHYNIPYLCSQLDILHLSFSTVHRYSICIDICSIASQYGM